MLADGRIRVFTGKIELGQGISTAVAQMAAEELNTDLSLIEVHLVETGVTPDEGYTAGSGSIVNSAMSVRYAAAYARTLLLERAAKKLGVPSEKLTIADGKVSVANDQLQLTFSRSPRRTATQGRSAAVGYPKTQRKLSMGGQSGSSTGYYPYGAGRAGLHTGPAISGHGARP